LKGKIEAMIQTVSMAQQLFSKAALVDHERLAAAQRAPDLVEAESCLQDALPPTFGPRFVSGELPGTSRKIPWRPSGGAATWSALRSNAARVI
jgi:L-rhamnose isomerase